MNPNTTKIVITDAHWGDCDIERAALDSSQYEVVFLQSRDPDAIIEAGHDADGLLVQRALVTRELLEALPQLRAVVRYGIGLDTIDLEAAKERGVHVSGVPDYCIDEMVEHTAMFIATAARHLWHYVDEAAGGPWGFQGGPKPQVSAEDPVGVVGAGRIGRAVVARFLKIGHPVVVFDPYVSEQSLPQGCALATSLADLAERVNHLSLHVPLVEQTRNLVDEPLMRILGPEGHLVNTARGGLIDEGALLRILDEGALGHASLDVLAEEPPGPTQRRLVAHKRTTITPHVGYLSTRSLHTLRRRAAELLDELLNKP